jgi:CubicO group peptidase (beta-lactamase class C family)
VLVTRVSGRSFGTFLAEWIVDPLGMHDPCFHVPASGIHRLPTS